MSKLESDLESYYDSVFAPASVSKSKYSQKCDFEKAFIRVVLSDSIGFSFFRVKMRFLDLVAVLLSKFNYGEENSQSGEKRRINNG